MQNDWIYHVLDCDWHDYSVAFDEECVFMYMHYYYADYSGI